MLISILLNAFLVLFIENADWLFLKLTAKTIVIRNNSLIL